MKSILIVLLIGLLGVTTTSCRQSSKMSATDFPGIYLVKYSHGSETLVLQPDGTYEQKYAPITGAIIQTNTGSWFFHSRPSAFVHLKNALLFDNSRSNRPQIPPKRTDLGLNVLIWWKDVELVLNDEEPGYKKQAKLTPGNSQQ